MSTGYRSPSVTLNITLAGLPSSTSLTAGQCSDSYSNSTFKDDLAATALTAVGNSIAPTNSSGQIELWVIPRLPDGTWPNIFTVAYAGSNAARTLVTRDQMRSVGRLLGNADTDLTANRVYSVVGREISSAFGYMPEVFAFFVTQNTGQNLAAAGNLLTMQTINLT